MSHHFEPERHRLHFLLTRELHLVSRQRCYQRLVVEELVRCLYGLRGERAVQRVGYQLQRAVIVVMEEREHFTVIQRPPSLVFGQKQRETAFRFESF